jgi:hypothetical protein
MNALSVDRPVFVQHLPLARLALCLDCDATFEIGADSCPASLDVNLPNYASAIVSTDEIVASIVAL